MCLDQELHPSNNPDPNPNPQPQPEPTAPTPTPTPTLTRHPDQELGHLHPGHRHQHRLLSARAARALPQLRLLWLGHLPEPPPQRGRRGWRGSIVKRYRLTVTYRYRYSCASSVWWRVLRRTRTHCSSVRVWGRQKYCVALSQTCTDIHRHRAARARSSTSADGRARRRGETGGERAPGRRGGTTRRRRFCPRTARTAAGSDTGLGIFVVRPN